MSFVKQRLKSDCGIACLAMLCDVTYDKAAGVILWEWGKYKGTTTKQLRVAALSFGYPVDSTPQLRLKVVREPKGWRDANTPAPSTSDWWYLIPPNSLVKIKRDNASSGDWHWVVWKKNKIYDPARGVFHPSRYNHKPSSYMQFLISPRKERQNERDNDGP